MIKKDKNKNDYYLTYGGYWVRDFTKNYIKGVDINQVFSEDDSKIILENELTNSRKMIQLIETENFIHPKIAIISDGYNFDKTDIINKIPDDVVIIGVNGAMSNWATQKKMHYYVINNPYDEALNYMSKGYIWPKCITSSKTSSKFVKEYKGMLYLYHTVPNENYNSFNPECSVYIDDYRNPICASLSLSYYFKAKKILLLFSDDVYEQERPTMQQLHNGKWIYPQQRIAHGLIDGMSYWLSKDNIKLGYHSYGPEYKHATYISEDNIQGFFNG